MQRAATAAALAAICGAGPGLAAPSAYDIAFVDAFEKACVPGRLTYEASREAARAAGWKVVRPDVHPELQAIMRFAEAEADDADLTDATFEYTAYAKPVAGRDHHLVMTRTSFVIGEPEDTPNPWVYVGCHLYNLDAEAPLDPAAVTALIGHPISNSHEQGGLISHVWGPPCPMPRTGDTYLTFVAESGETAAALPFSGIALKFSTSELRPGDAEPDPYC